MKLSHAILLASTLFLTACATSDSSSGSAPVPTPANVPIVVYNVPPQNYRIVGQVSGPSMRDLEDQARKLGANGIINPRSKDPVSGWATTDAIKVGK